MPPDRRPSYTDNTPCESAWCCLCVCLRRTSFSWVRRRYVWRSTFLYNLITVLVLVGNMLTFILLSLISSRSFFINYRCGRQAISLINTNFVAMMGVTGIMGLCALMMARLTNMFSNYSLSDFMSIGKWADRLGCLVKWVPWLVAVCGVGWFVINIVNITWIFADPKSWCSRRWSEKGIVAVVNCRLWYRADVPCLSTQEAANMENKVASCNDGDYLQASHFFMFTPKTVDGRGCSFKTIEVCRAFKQRFSSFGNGQAVDWTTNALSPCLGQEGENALADDFLVSSDESSDLYRYVLMYVVGWCVALLTLGILFYYVKESSNFEAMFYQPQHPGDNVLLKVIRPLTPWSK
ncbi:putative membrane protein [Toxoplasma gondii TgCatPRC2]|uniref:Membrane protein n=16 Tax=Toxoplasma gondii TaxID=5811 RepID=A0A125YUR3_TOXGV|nr:membrane protein, putative [Toxoplasma gondii ME49]EPR61573.1 putative membrane protein [Toxoplasma gondii GT1]ESS33000.1 putative membrane protein [Toxoplasma gondii VEG]KAF4642944.1 putative membrane protein [Toxoplasma gondii]KFG41011.1 putative membrane protein [Toxoplasma gondii GAB2-2007-GAL-DOM2]KFG45630.1 putative membrane protein [Toxoplasma gondii p89]KFG53604.1 putative membrane protein [Toxoplasma gondii FOU]KFG62011.1 putative membrane protein [Toxoplasma gondii RUB]KFH06998|eukprot:XP_002367515.2 membrane protein, putative [Toxoplasma gondii ME49]